MPADIHDAIVDTSASPIPLEPTFPIGAHENTAALRAAVRIWCLGKADGDSENFVVSNYSGARVFGARWANARYVRTSPFVYVTEMLCMKSGM